MSALKYPKIPRVDQVDVMHGVSVSDPFRWLEEEGDETKSFIKGQQELFSEYTSSPGFSSIQPKLRAKMESQYNYERVGLPGVRGGRAFFFRNTGLQNQDVLFKASVSGQPSSFAEVADATALLDLNTEYPDGTTSLNTHSYNKEGSLLAYALAHGGSDWVTIRIRDVATGVDLPNDVIPWVKFTGISWLGPAGFFYSRYPAPAGVKVEGVGAVEDGGGKDAGTETAANHSAAVYFHRVGTKAEEDLLVYASPEQPQWRAGLGVTEDERYLLLSTSKGTDPVNRLYVSRASTFHTWASCAKPRPLAPGEIPPRQSNYSYLPFRRVRSPCEVALSLPFLLTSPTGLMHLKLSPPPPPHTHTHSLTRKPSEKQCMDNFEASWDCVASLDTRLFLQTNFKAPKSRIMVLQLPTDETEWENEDGGPLATVPAGETPLDIDIPCKPTPLENLHEVLPENSSEVLDWAAHCAGNLLVTCVLKDVVNVLRVYCLGGPGDVSPLPSPYPLLLPAPGTVASFSGRPHLPRIYIKHVSFTTPGTSLTVDLSLLPPPASPPTPISFAPAPFWSARIPGFIAENFVVKQEFVEAGDGAKIPVFLVHAKNATFPAPTLLYALSKITPEPFHFAAPPCRFFTARLFTHMRTHTHTHTQHSAAMEDFP